MPSIIPEYNNDIFISYRQKDNKGDRWVSEFVEALKTELESTFKEEISVYFDINPHDGLLETHDVDESLKEKLKCLIFIPIISRTYCDPKSFAWEHEFKTFVELAKNDQYGLKVKLPNGNVASRVLPVKIYDLDTDDINLCESVLGGVLRGIDFIYAEPGVNRPLKPDDDEKTNLNKTKYRNQVNKVGNAVKGIISAIKHYNPQTGKVQQEVTAQTSIPQKNKKTPIIITSAVALALIILGILFIPKLFKPAGELEKSIAVLPFKNDSPDQERMYFINGTMEAILDNLCKIEDLRVVSRNSVEQYRDNPKPTPVVAKEMDVSYVLEGSGHRDGNNVRLFVQLLEGKTDRHIWSRSYDADIEDIFSMQSKIAQMIASEIKAVITPEEKDLIEKVPTTNLTAYDFYQRGNEEHWKYQTDPHNLAALNKAEDLYKKAMQYDPTFAQAYVGLANVYWNKNFVAEIMSENFLDSVLILANNALTFDNNLVEAYVIRGNYYRVNGYKDQALKEYDKAIDINPSSWEAYAGRAFLYQNDDMVKIIDNFHRVLSINKGRELPYIFWNMVSQYNSAGFPEIAQEYMHKKLSLDDDSVAYFLLLASIKFNNGDIENSIRLFRKVFILDSTNIESLYQLGMRYSEIGKWEESLYFYEKWLEQLDQTLVASYRTNGMHRVGCAYWMNNRFDEAQYYFDLQIEYNNRAIRLDLPSAQNFYAYYDRAAVYAFRGEKEKAYEDLQIFNQRIRMPSWMVAMIKVDPLFDSIRNEPEFQQIVRDVEAKYQAEHERVKKWLEKQGML